MLAPQETAAWLAADLHAIVKSEDCPVEQTPDIYLALGVRLKRAADRVCPGAADQAGLDRSGG